MSDDKQTISERIADVKARIAAGEVGLVDELERLLKQQAADIEPPDEDPIFDRLTVKTRKYTMTQAALDARRNNAQHSTGPTSNEGKAAAARNSWKHGQHSRTRMLGYGKPCQTTCPKYPCKLVNDGETEPGQDCLDKEYLAESMHAIAKALESGDTTDLKKIVTLQLGQSLSVIDELQSSILEYGVYMKSEKLNKDGEVIGYDLKPNPSLLPLANLLKAAGVTMGDFMITPREISRDTNDKEIAETAAGIFRAAGNALNSAREKKK